MTDPPLCAPPLPDTRPPKNPIPPGACDSHFHVFDKPSPQVADRSYTAPPAPLAAYRNVQHTLGLDRSVIVQPSVYGTDNRTTLQSLPTDGSMKAIVVVDDDTKSDELKALAARGAVGARANLMFQSGAQTENLTALTGSMADLGWHLQVLADVSALPDLADFVSRLSVPVVFDHMGHVPARKGINNPGVQTLLALLDHGNVWVKLSGAYRIAPVTPSDAAPVAKALIAANPDRLVWGTDWPHPAIKGPMPDDGDLLDMLFDWADPETAHKILVQNPEQLYGFPQCKVPNGS